MKPTLGRFSMRLAMAATLLAAGCVRQPTGQQPPPPVPVVEPPLGATGAPVSGAAAIAPAPGAQISVAQIHDFVIAHHVPGAVATNLTIVSTNRVTHQQLRALLHSANLGLADQAPLYLVVMSGRFVFSGPPGQTPTYPYAIEVFDARTGNLLQIGGLPRAPRLPAGG
jgi:hypothetical protein